MAYKQIFFDLDHTLWDFEMNSRECLQDMFGEFCLEGRGVPGFGAFHESYVGHNERMWERFRKGYITREELRWKRLFHTLLDFRIGDQRLVQDLSVRYLELLPTKTHLFPDTVEVLDYLKAKGYPLHLITNGFEETQHLKLKHSGIGDYFTCIVTSESAGCLKPQREIFEHALRQSCCAANEAIMIGDTLEVDIEGARNAGIDQVYFNPARPAKGIRPTYTIQRLSALRDIL
jgi:putative hydrolase of the HAD superfamily